MTLIMIQRARDAVVMVAVLVSLASGLSSCTRSAANQPPTPSPAPTKATSVVVQPSASPGSRPSRSPESKARREVIALVRDYYSTEQAIAASRKVPLKRYYEVAAGEYVQILLQNAQARRAKNQRVTGEVQFSKSKIQEFAFRSGRGQVPTSTVRTCLDVSGVDVVDGRGKSVVEKGRANAYTELLTVKKLPYGWRVVDGENTETTRCVD